MKRSLREILAESHIAAVAIALLLLWSLDAVLWAISGPVHRAAEFVVTTVAIHGVPYSSGSLSLVDRIELFTAGSYLYSGLLSFAAAWVLSHWVNRVGPFRALIQCRAKLARRNDA